MPTSANEYSANAQRFEPVARIDDAWTGLAAHYLDPHLGQPQIQSEEKWPLSYTVAFVLGSSALLWTGIIAGIAHFV